MITLELILGSSVTLAVFLYFSIRKSNLVKEESSYLLADRKTSLLPLVATLVMTEFNPSTLLAFSGAGYFAGVWALSLPFVFLVGLGFYTVSVAKKWKEWDGYSVAEVFEKKYGTGMGKLASVLLILAMMGFSATYVKSLGLIFGGFFLNPNPWILNTSLVVLILVWNLWGGLVSIIRTDLVSFFAVIILLPILLIYPFIYFDLNINLFLSTVSIEDGRKILPPGFILSLILITMFTYIAAPWYGQKIFSAASPAVAKKAVGISSAIVFLFYSLPLLAVISLKAAGQILPAGQEGVPFIIQNFFPDIAKGFAYIVLFAIGATTLSGVWSAQTTMFIGDFLGKEKKEKSNKSRAVLLTLGFSIVSLFLSNLLVDSILNQLILANIPVFALSFSLLAGFYWDKASKPGAYLSALIGVSWGSFTYFHFGQAENYTFYWAVIGLPLVFGSGVFFSLIFPDSNRITSVKK
ncbi:sodium:solute symporter family transporter [Leptospira sp. 'Mane']|uniref:sodium:solute symporter family transporter n=1 Tax=Leptospira sp. 'Mane' TaxID=3387407 RepID=UPI00398B1353